MRITSTALLSALALAVFAHGGVLACSSDSDAGGPVAGGAGTAGASGTAGTAPAAGGSALGGATALGGSAGAASGAGGGGGTNATAGGAAGAASGAGGATGGAGGSAGSAGGGGTAGMAGAAPFALSSPALMNNPDCAPNHMAACAQFASDFVLQAIGGANHSPELDWSAGPSGTLSYAIVLYDLTAPYTHWAVWNIPAGTSKLPASLAAGSSPNGLTGVKQASFYMNKDAYAGPGVNAHVYQFTLYALKVAVIAPTLSGTNPQESVRSLLEGSADVLAKVTLSAASPPK